MNGPTTNASGADARPSQVHPASPASASESSASGIPAGAPGCARAQTHFSLKAQLAQMLKGGVIMDVTNAAEARIAQEAGACAVMALERVPSDIRAQGGVARMSHPNMIREIQAAVSIPVMAKCRIGHFVEAQVLQSLEVDYIDESEVLSLADDQFHVDKHSFAVPFVCGCRNLGEALRRIGEGAAMIRTKGEAGTGNIVEAVRHARQVAAELRRVLAIKGQEEELRALARELGVGVDALHEVQKAGRLPVVQFAAGGVATPADAALLMQLGMDGVFVGSGIFKSENPPAMARAIVKAVTHYRDPAVVAQCCAEVGQAMKGLEINANVEQFAKREKV